ncbi:MAG TPA: hypothetical protein VJ873_02920 [bacterium]|nr:hypothetical protein [bacterium]
MKKKRERSSMLFLSALLIWGVTPSLLRADPLLKSGDGNREMDYDIALKASFNLNKGVVPGSDAWALGGMIDELYMGFTGQLTPHIKVTGTLDTVNLTSHSDLEYLPVQDLRTQFEYGPELNIWVGRIIPATDRDGLSGGFQLNSWNFPGLVWYFPGVFEGRMYGAEVWGNDPAGVFKWQLGCFDGRQGAFNSNISPLFSGRLMLCLLDPEEGYYYPAAYYGKKEILSLAVGGMYQADGAGTANGSLVTSMGDYSEYNADLLFEKKVTDTNVASVESSYYRYNTQGATGAVEGEGFFVSGGYLIGQIQPNLRWQRFTPTGQATADRLDGGLAYIVDGANTRIALNYGKVFGQAQDEFQLGTQVIF